MIFVLAGTQDGREIAQRLARESGEAVLASVVSDYGKALAKAPALEVSARPLDEAALRALLVGRGVRAVVDASHPYAAHISQTAIRLCAALGIRYIRYERAQSELPPYEKLYRVSSYEEAARKAAALGRRVFLTTGSRNLAVFANAPELADCELTARVLPESGVLAQCARLGFTPKQIVALQGPFSQALNRELYKQYGAEVVVTKNSGSVGGTDTKLAAAMELGLAVVVIERPAVEYPLLTRSYEEIVEALAGK